MNWYHIPGFPGYTINDEGVCITPFGKEMTIVGRNKDCYRLRKNGRDFETKISAILEAARNGTQIKRTRRFSPRTVRVIHSRLCHDCKKPTSDYRCPTCLKKWRLKHGVPECGDRETSFDVIFG